MSYQLDGIAGHGVLAPACIRVCFETVGSTKLRLKVAAVGWHLLVAPLKLAKKWRVKPSVSEFGSGQYKESSALSA